ncbi:MAG: A/G-specific adenine glycosylase [Verrucomicrobia bacterium]|nr:A/G-specific adenine glycosylase [Verrucomicrobiota bacterium]
MSARHKHPGFTTVRKCKAIVPLLLSWFATNARDLPWRRTRDPYSIWISEIMLQQTQVKTVIPYWQRWMRELPTLQSLARARPEKILKLWEGLGYYTRALNLHKAARQIMAMHAGKFPEKFDDILALPGVGRYTAGAICSIAFNQPTPILDGNVIRVLTRVFGIGENPRDKLTNTKLWQLAETLVQTAADISRPASRIPHPASLASHFNQSLMELGALVCTPRSPRCCDCPARKHCIAWRENRIAQLPNLARRAATTGRRFIAFVVKCNENFLVRQRPSGVVNAQLWEFPNLELNGESDLKVVAKSALGFAPKNLRPLCVIKHSITRYRITLEAYQSQLKLAPTKTRQPDQWLAPTELKQLAFASAHKKILAQLSP